MTFLEGMGTWNAPERSNSTQGIRLGLSQLVAGQPINLSGSRQAPMQAEPNVQMLQPIYQDGASQPAAPLVDQNSPPVVVDMGDGRTVEFPDQATAQQYFQNQQAGGAGPSQPQPGLQDRPLGPSMQDALQGRGMGAMAYQQATGQALGWGRNPQSEVIESFMAATPAASASATDGALLGFGDEYMAGLSSVLGVQPDGEGGANWFDYSQPIGERYTRALDQIRVEQEQFREDHPGMAVTSEVAGSFLVPGAGAARYVNQGRSTSGRIARGAGAGALAGGAHAFGEGEGIDDRLSRAPFGGITGLLAGGTLAGMGQGFNRAIEALRRRGADAEVIPGVEGLRMAANGLYEHARELGGNVPLAEMRRMVAGAGRELQEGGFDEDLHPTLNVAMRRLSDASQQGDVSFQELETLRRILGNAASSQSPDERRLASMLMNRFDGMVDELPGGGVLGEARDTWARLRRVETIEQAIERASLTDNFARGLQTQFRALLRYPNRLRGFSAAEREAVERVANGTISSNSLRALAAIMSPDRLSGIALSGGALYGGAGLATIGIPAAGYAARGLGNMLTRRAATNARDTVAGSGLGSVVDAMLPRPNPLSFGVVPTAIGLGVQ